MPNVNEHFYRIETALDNIIFTKDRLQLLANIKFDQGEEIIIDRILNKQVPEILKRLSQITDIERYIILPQKENIGVFIIALRDSIKMHPIVWKNALKACNKHTVVTLVVNLLEQASNELNQVLHESLNGF